MMRNEREAARCRYNISNGDDAQHADETIMFYPAAERVCAQRRLHVTLFARADGARERAARRTRQHACC